MLLMLMLMRMLRASRNIRLRRCQRAIGRRCRRRRRRQRWRCWSTDEHRREVCHLRVRCVELLRQREPNRNETLNKLTSQQRKKMTKGKRIENQTCCCRAREPNVGKSSFFAKLLNFELIFMVKRSVNVSKPNHQCHQYNIQSFTVYSDQTRIYYTKIQSPK